MANLSKSNFFDAGANPPVERTTTHKGRRVKEKIPNGYVERWVDKAGNVLMAQIIPSGVPRTPAAVDIGRAKLIRAGYIEHKACPLSSGTLEPEDFPEGMQVPCKRGTYGPGHACKHVEHYIGERHAKNKAEREERHEPVNAERRRKELADRNDAAQRQRLNENIEGLINIVGGKLGIAPTPTATPDPTPATAAAAATPANSAADVEEDEDELEQRIVASELEGEDDDAGDASPSDGPTRRRGGPRNRRS